MKNKKIIAVYPGSFDPPTNGHIDIIARAAKIFPEVIIAITHNYNKKHMFSLDERISMMKEVVSNIKNAKVSSFSGLLVDYLNKIDSFCIVRGLRALSDFEYEFQMALTNKKLNPDVETLFLTTSAENMYLSSSMVKQIASMGGDITDFVPPAIHDDIVKRLKKEG